MTMADDIEIKRLLNEEAMKIPEMNIVVSGMAGRFPKADSVAEFEDNLVKGVDMINDHDDVRWKIDSGTMPARAGRIQDICKFDSEFFGMTAKDADLTDHQLRLMLEVVYEAILDSGLNPAQLRGSNTALFLGAHNWDFEKALGDKTSMKTGYAGKFALRLAQYFDFRGMNSTLDTACASGFSALDVAIQAISGGLVEQAIVCGVTIQLSPQVTGMFMSLQMVSPGGNSRFLDAGADGYVKADACVALMLQRKSLALRSYASFLGVASCADGYKGEGITFPSSERQETLIRETMSSVGVTTNNIEYYEAHGTGTPAGDKAEADAIAHAYFPLEKKWCVSKKKEVGVCERKIGPLLVGSSKSNMGHSEAASSLCALVKVALMLDNELIYRSLNFEKPNPRIKALLEGKLKPVLETRELTAKIVPVSCFGFGGSNVHAIVRANERPAIEFDDHLSLCDEFSPRLVVMFGRSRTALEAFFAAILDEQSRGTRNCLTDDFLALVDALSAGSIDRLMDYRGYLLIDRRARAPKRELTREIAHCKLSPVPPLRHDEAPWQRPVHIQEHKLRRCNLILPGLGCHWPKMAAGLTNYAPFWSTIKRLAVFLAPFKAEVDLIRLLTEADEKELNSSNVGLLISVIAYEIALINIVRDQIGLNNLGFVVGHSIGEISAAYAVGLLDEREAIMAAYRLSKALWDNKHRLAGKLVAAALSEEEALKMIKDENCNSVRVCCVNGAKSVTISGLHEEMDCFIQILRDNKIPMKTLESAGLLIHNDAVCTDEIKVYIQDSLRSVMNKKTDYSREEHPNWLSCLPSCTRKEILRKADFEYFSEMAVKKVDFLSALEVLEEDSIVLELAPSGLFESQLRSMDKPSKLGELKFHYVKLMSHSTPTEEQHTELLKSLGKLYLAGATFSKLTEFSPKKNNLSAKQLFPVRRQTPSLSSIIRWKHERDHFVPLHPNYFCTSLGRAMEVSVNILEENQQHFADHIIDGRSLYPATGYLYLAWHVFSSALLQSDTSFAHRVELVPVEFRKVKLFRAVVLASQSVHFYVQMNFATGHFRVNEKGGTLAEGYVSAPVEKANGLMYESVRKEVMDEKLHLSMKKADIYEQFRVRGYDYGPQFQNIEECSPEGRHSRISYNGYFTTFADSVLQTLILTQGHHLGSQLMFLPTGFDYVRIQPSVLLNRIEQAGFSDGFKDFKRDDNIKKGMMLDMLRSETEDKQRQEATWNIRDKITASEKSKGDKNKRKPCKFDTFCDPVLGVIITDGFEIRGLQAIPMKRKIDSKALMRKSFQFVKDVEDPVEDELLLPSDRNYVKFCDSMTQKLLAKISKICHADEFEQKVETNHLEVEILEKYLGEVEEEEGSLIASRRQNYTVICLLNKLINAESDEAFEQILTEVKMTLTMDLINRYPLSERFLVPMLEMVQENVCESKKGINVLEINEGEGLMHEYVKSSLKTNNPALKVEYSLAHPDIELLLAKKLLLEHDSITHKLTDFEALFNNLKAEEYDLIIYKDSSCSELPAAEKDIKQGWKSEELIVGTLSRTIRAGAYLLVVMRKRLTLAEQILLTLSDPSSFENLKETTSIPLSAAFMERSKEINMRLKLRCEKLATKAHKMDFLCVQKKSDMNGYLHLLFKKHSTADLELRKQRVLIRVMHDSKEKIKDWLDALKLEFRGGIAKKTSDETSEERKDDQVEDNKSSTKKRTIWLCAVATRQQPFSGLIGLVKTLRKEQDPRQIRCYFDCHTFAQCDEPISVADIERCSKFQEALNRDLVWNCVDADGDFGAHRYLSVDKVINYEDCLCADQATLTEGGEIEANSDEYFYANTAKPGELSSFSWFELPFKFVNGEERKKLLKVAYSALNFKDILLATGQLPPGALSAEAAASDCQLGLEFSGCDKAGERFMGMVNGKAIASHVLCSEKTAIKIKVPSGMSLAEAATIPVVYATAIMALVCRGGASRGESVLIHAGSGGVGQAAIRLSGHLGLKIYTTVGTQEKRNFLLQEFGYCLSDDRIFSSRNCEFEERIMELTQGRGVDLVLNSLAGDKLQASIRCLSDGGRFLEIGKYDLAMDSTLELLTLDTNKTFHGIHLDKLFDSDSSVTFRNDLSETLKIIEDGLKSGYVKPIKYTVFEKHNIEAAFRFMAAGKHIGKVLIKIGGEAMTIARSLAVKKVPRFQVSAKKSYIVTGGLGGFGIELIKWLVELGARHFVVASRSGIKSEYQRLVMLQLSSYYGAKIVILDKDSADTTQHPGAEKLCQVALDMSPIRRLGAVFHLAAVQKDSLIEDVSADDFELVCAAKVETLIRLNSVICQMSIELDHFVVFSSVASGLGNIGQASYAYANSCVERVCEQRRRAGLHALAIQWGMIGDVGMAFRTFGSNDVVVGSLLTQRIPSCLATLSQLSCLPIAVCSSLVEEKKQAEGSDSDLLQMLIHVLGIKNTAELSDNASLGELGLDSLQAVEVRQFLIREHDITVEQKEIRALTIKQVRELDAKGTQTKKTQNQTATSSPQLALNQAKNPKPLDIITEITKSEHQQRPVEISIQNDESPEIILQSMEIFSRKHQTESPPQLRLPSMKFCRLNSIDLPSSKTGSHNDHEETSIGSQSFKQPVFVIPPIDGDLSALKKVCSMLERPCISINWTYELGKQHHIERVVELCVELLKSFDWSKKPYFNCKMDDVAGQVIDLVGYLDGAVVAFEVMVELHKLERLAAKRLINGLDDNITGGLRPGRLILIDCTPEFLKFSVQILRDKSPDHLSLRLNEAVMQFIAMHTNNFDGCSPSEITSLYKNLQQMKGEKTFKFAAKKLVELLGIKTGSNNRESLEISTDDERCSYSRPEYLGEDELEEKVKEVARTMEVFCCRRELAFNYSNSSTLRDNCVLIRSSKSHQPGLSEDLNLSPQVEGKVQMFVYEGDQYTFLDTNCQEVGKIVNQYLSETTR